MSKDYAIALFVPSNVTLGRLYEMLDKLADLDIDLDYDTIELQDNGMAFECQMSEEIEDLEEKIKAIANGDMMIDWDTMSGWGPYDDFDDQMDESEDE